jgi:hypothetical protein
MVRDNLKAKNLLDQAAAFTRATGLFMVRLYKEEIEVLLRTPCHAGFQLLDLHDFPGQGTALVGTLDPFWDSKGLIQPEEWRRFCGPTVPLLRLPRRTYLSSEGLEAEAAVAHFGPASIDRAEPVWTVRDVAGVQVASGTLRRRAIPTGQVTPLGSLQLALARVPAPAKVTVTIALRDTDGKDLGAANDWDIWVYPVGGDPGGPHDVTVSQSWDDAARAVLAAGGKVLLLPAPESLAQAIPGSFTPVFWSPVWFKRGAGTMSILCDPNHPALALFPTDMHTDWQWYDLLVGSRTMILDATPADFRPVVQMIDNFARNHKLGNLFEATVGKGRLVVCSMDLRRNLDKRPAARQMYRSLMGYMGSSAFRPAHELDLATLDKILRPAPPSALKVEEPKGAGAAVLRVKAAAGVAELKKAAPWDPAADKVIARKDGFDYKVRGDTWRDQAGAAWHSQDDLVVTVTCPKGFQGKLYAHFHDWNKLGRVAEISFQDKEIGALDHYDGAGKWLVFPVTAEASASGRLKLSSRPTHANTMITEIVLVPGEAK